MILTMPGREQFLARLMAVLKPQVEEHDDIEILVRKTDPDLDLGTNRQLLLESVSGRYVCFIDDDDLVAAKYIASIYPLLDGVDYIGFTLQMYTDGQKQKPTFHSLRYKEWNADQDGFYRDISHLNPIRRELALRAKMSGGFGEDERWSTQLRNLGIVKTEHYIGEPMYFYFWRSNKNDPPSFLYSDQVTRQGGDPPVVRLPCPECGSTATTMAGGMKNCNQCGARW
jgi:glycosyltransferase involved in cell wall biosynthesis